MTKISEIISVCILVSLLTGCSQVLQNVNLDINEPDNLSQEDFNVVEKTLTLKEAKKQKNEAYLRTVLQNGRGENARPIPERLALLSELPKSDEPSVYKIGINDTITFSRLIENNRSPLKKLEDWPSQQITPNYKLGIGDTLALTLISKAEDVNTVAPNNDGDRQNLIINSQQNDDTIETKARIGSDGSALLLEVGRLEANGKSLNELRSEVRNILIRNGVSPRFQLEIVEFKSQKSYLTVNSSSQIVTLDDQRTTIRDVLTLANVGFKPGVITRIRLQRDNKEFSISLRDLYDDDTTNIDVQADDHIFVEDSSAEIVSTSSIVDHEGNVVFETVGKIRAFGRSLDELRTEIKNLMHRVPDSNNVFQIQITDFSSQRAFLNTPEANEVSGVVIPIIDTPTTLVEVLTKNGFSIDSNNITRINLQRGVQTYSFTLDDLFNPNTPNIYLKAEDHITTEILSYKENKVFILGGVTPSIFNINPANRETLADVLFTSNGVLSTSGAKRSEVYLLRGSNPVVAYHLDAQNPTRLIIADAMELRPNDILYVAEQPIISFNRTLGTILPLRILLRDIQDENIP